MKIRCLSRGFFRLQAEAEVISDSSDVWYLRIVHPEDTALLGSNRSAAVDRHTACRVGPLSGPVLFRHLLSSFQAGGVQCDKSNLPPPAQRSFSGT
jgi:hypothetical protein